MRLREPHRADASQPETAGWTYKVYLIGTSAGLRLVFASSLQLTHGPYRPVGITAGLKLANNPSATASDGPTSPGSRSWPVQYLTVPYGTLYIDLTRGYGTLRYLIYIRR